MLAELIDAAGFRLRPFRMDDLEAVFAYASDEEYLRYLPVPLPYTRDSARDFLAKQVALDRETNASWAISIGEEPCGGLNIRFFGGHRRAEIGYAVARRLWGRGIATQAARHVVGAAFAEYPQLDRVRATADTRNRGSIRVMEKLGMTLEDVQYGHRPCRSELTDEVVYGVRRREWRT
jgi:[ribosomal protein S5]-alanine N-acetyltransferase